MTGKKWDDNKIENLLGDMPNIQDERPKSDILTRLKLDERLNSPNRNRNRNRNRNKSKKWIPALVAVAALLVFSLLIPSMLQQNEGAMDEVSEAKSDANLMRNGQSENSKEVESEKSAMDVASDPAAKAFSVDPTRMAVESHVLVQEDMQGMRTFRIGMVNAATIIPMTFLIPAERIAADFPDGDPDSVALYNKYAADIPEVDLGFEDYHPYKGEITVQDGVVVHKIPAEHPYDLATATMYFYMNSLRETFTDYATFKIVDQNGDFAEFDQVGTTEVIDLKRPLPYYKYIMPSGHFYLIPYESGDSNTVVEALLAMKVAQNDIVEELVPDTLAYVAQEQDGVAVITFKDQLDLSSMDPVDANAMLEGFMLTATTFNKRLRLDNVMQDTFGKYDLTTELPKLVGVNPTHIFE